MKEPKDYPGRLQSEEALSLRDGEVGRGIFSRGPGFSLVYWCASLRHLEFLV